ncbi:MAG: sigma-54 dependent transcriptional regulator [Bdellovibrionaceae bacterium]|nr:sigma-54 dependent transcriptional regulator [Pseudobdellovibrionaceae bacterium]
MTDQRLKLLVVDDDDLIIQSIRMCVPEQWRVVAANSRREIPTHTNNDAFDAAFVDMHLSKNSTHAEGPEIIGHLHEVDPHLEIVAISGDLDRELMETCLKRGASRFLAKPLSPEEVTLTLEKIEALRLIRTAAVRGKTQRAAWIGESAVSRDVLRQVASLKGEPGPIYIEGESGTGKEVVAGMIHGQEDDRPFISVNVAALPENVFESEVFGHIRGAFTGADQNKMGLAEAAHNGDLFLDEIEALPLSQQAKLLRFLESGEIRRVGAKETIRVHVRVIAASNQNLSQMVREGKFREDLLWRLNGKRVQLPSLRSRAEDIPQLAEHFLAQERPRRNKNLSDDAKVRLQAHSWPGNVRELKRVCEQLSLYSPLPIIRAEDVARVLPVSMPASSDDSASIDLSQGLGDLLAGYEARVIRLALKADSDIEKAAQLLKISRSSLYKKIKDYNIEIDT